MSAIGLASLGVFCEDPALGMSSLGVFCEAIPGVVEIGDIFDPALAVIPSDDRIRVLSGAEIATLIAERRVTSVTVVRSLSSLTDMTMASVTPKRALEVQHNGKKVVDDSDRKKVHVIINGLLVEAELSQKDLLALLEAADLQKSGKLN